MLAEGRTPLDALSSTLPMGTASGAPKVRAMEIIDELEPVRRGPYAGAFGYLSVTRGDGHGADPEDGGDHRRQAPPAGRRRSRRRQRSPNSSTEESLNKLAALRKAVAMATEGLA